MKLCSGKNTQTYAQDYVATRSAFSVGHTVDMEDDDWWKVYSMTHRDQQQRNKDNWFQKRDPVSGTYFSLGSGEYLIVNVIDKPGVYFYTVPGLFAEPSIERLSNGTKVKFGTVDEHSNKSITSYVKLIKQ